MITTEQNPTEVDGLEIFDDVHEVRREPVAYTALQMVIAVLGYALVLGLVVVLIVRLIELLWPVLVFVVLPWLMSLVV
ncbi:hypothetical protein K2F54_15895 [Cryobacterium sp. 1639]|uniref:hypothetical protein n=1 Tax=Cryobacterium inferilacus TaxID=2866629 RepID=UPI001C73CFD2|nr:hypothetical protein [Cryobacterium sp. 1639]MBX0301456.1 hypothetical protein [Cryobacterium sp. 1639]